MNEPDLLLKRFGNTLRQLRTERGLSQEELGFRSGLDRTYVSGLERGKRNVSLINIHAIASALQVDAALLLAARDRAAIRDNPRYRLCKDFAINCGFHLTGEQVLAAATQTAEELEALPFSLFVTIDLKSLSGIVGALFATHVARQTGGIVNPIEKGHPDVVPLEAAGASEQELRNYGSGLEIKCTVGNVKKGSELKCGDQRFEHLTAITWQAHHREVRSLMGLVADFAGHETRQGKFPLITGVFFTDSLLVDDWGAISGITGRNTKVTGMGSSGKKKMGIGWVLLLDSQSLIDKYSKLLAFHLEP